MVDQEPHRSVQLIRRIDTRVPVPLLSQHVSSSWSTTGRLVDLRAGVGKGTGAGGSSWGVGTSGADASSGAGTGTGTGRWNAVAKSTLGTPRPGSATPARVPSPAAEAVKSREVSPRSSRLSLSGAGTGGAGAGAGAGVGTRGGVWMSPSVQAQRERENVTVIRGGGAPAQGVIEIGAGVGVGAVQETVEEVPDDWEDAA